MCKYFILIINVHEPAINLIIVAKHQVEVMNNDSMAAVVGAPTASIVLKLFSLCSPLLLISGEGSRDGTLEAISVAILFK